MIDPFFDGWICEDWVAEVLGDWVKMCSPWPQLPPNVRMQHSQNVFALMLRMQHSRNALSLSSLKITTSLLGDRSPSSREIVIIRELFTASRSISWLTLYHYYKKALRQLVLTELRRTLQNCNVYGLGCYFLMVLCLTLFPGKWRVAQVPWPVLDVIVRSKFSWAVIFLTRYSPIPVDLVVWWPFLPEKPLS